MKTKMVFVVVALLSLLGCRGAKAETGLKFDYELKYPPNMTLQELALAEEEVLPENWNRTRVEYATDHGQKASESDEGGLSPYVEVMFTQRRGKDSADSFGSATLYAEVPITDTVSVWATGYSDPAFKATYYGVAKKFGNIQVGIGGGDAVYGDVRHRVFNPWVYYSGEEYEALAAGERYRDESEEPWFYKWYVEKKFENFSVGLYGEKGFGIGPKVTWSPNKHVKVWATIPIHNRPETGAMKFLFAITLSY
jgi:hypothetical protein